ncbi:hypothetical protein [Streptomyces sp. NPDC012510]|uniref:hypothetical protein n=1 Tax=Streptomyces sp. NPDC012510 TaxID=3364838 RepID=UPI0036EBD2C4
MTSGRITSRAVAVVLALFAVLPVDGAAADQSWPVDTPDRALAPRVYTPDAAEDRVEPRDAAAGTYDLVEHVPLSEAGAGAVSGAGAVAGAEVTRTTLTGPCQRQVERYLKRKADGKQSRADCLAIRAFQIKHELEPAIGSRTGFTCGGGGPGSEAGAGEEALCLGAGLRPSREASGRSETLGLT